MVSFVTTVHILVSIFMIFVILLQPGKGEGLGGALGGGGNSSSVFGGRGSVTFLSKITTGCAVVFMLTSLTLAYRSSHSDSVLRARRNLAAQDTAKKTDAKTTAPTLPTGQTAPAPATGGAVIPVPGPAPTAPAQPTAVKPAAPAKPLANPKGK
jgi:preprotein translocase subunit SecG